MKDNTILVLGGGALAVVAVGGYLVYKAAEKAKQEAQKAAGDAACTAVSAPRNLLNSLTAAVTGKRLAGTSCTDKRDASTYTGVPDCPDGQYWNGNEGKCMPNETAVRAPSVSNNASTGTLLGNNNTAPLTSTTNPWASDIIITRPSGEKIEVHPVTAPAGYKVVYSNTSGNCPDGSAKKVDPSNSMYYCTVPVYSSITNPAIAAAGVDAALGKTAPATPTSTTGVGNNILGFTVGQRSWDETAW